MKQEKSVFLTATLVSILSLYGIDSHAESVVCGVGYMLPAGQKSCVPCDDSNLKKTSKNNPATLWCPGGKFVIEQKHQGIQICSAETLADSKHKKCEKKKLVSSRSAKKINSSVKPSAKNSVARAPIVKTDAKKKINPTIKSANFAQITCKPGTYLPMNGKSASDCKSCLDGYYCTGGKWTPDPSMNQGLTKCAAGLVPDSTKTKCYDPKSNEITCKPGTYLPMDSKSCVSCLDGYYCQGGKWTPNPSMNQGLIKCAAGLISNSDKTLCKTPDAMDCKAGEYIPANSTKCAKCTGDNKYCPGVAGKKSDVDQGIYLCPDPSKTNAEKTACVLKLDKNMMQYGPGGQTVAISEQCWKNISAEEYIKCMFGGKVKLPQK